MSTTNNSKQESCRPIPHSWAFDLATKLAEDLFALGYEPDSPTQRIEFKGGHYLQERGQGGLCREALVRWLARALERHAPHDNKVSVQETARLDFLLQFLAIDDVGDEDACPGVIVDHEALEEKLGFGPLVNGKAPGLATWGEDLRSVLDKAIVAHANHAQAETERTK